MVAIDGGIDLRVGLKGEGAGLKEEGHESQLDIIFFQELFTQFLSGFSGFSHVNILESGEHGIGVLGVFKSLGNSLSQS